MVLKYKVANDLGYSSLKVTINNRTEIVPSVIAIQRPQNFAKPMTFDTDGDRNVYFHNLADQMDVTVASPSVSLQGRFLVGQRALDSGLPTRAFDVNDFSGKAQSDLSLILTLARIANQAVTDTFAANKSLDDIIKVKVEMSTALPITEGKTPNATENYAARYTKGKHLVTIYNFDQPITVEVVFTDVYVGLEGEVAQVEIVNADGNLKSQIKRDFDESYPELKDEVTADDLTGLENVMGIDVGEGTTDFSVIINGRANANASTSLETGYGNMLQDALSILQHEGVNLSTRGELNNFLSKPVSPLARKRQEHVRQTVFDQLDQLVDQIIDTASETMRHAGSAVELVYVYGGGSIPLRANTNMRERLVEKLKNFSGGYDIPVVWISATRAQTLNEDGLKLIVDNMSDMTKSKSK